MKSGSLFNIAVLPFAVAVFTVIGFSDRAKAAIFSGSVNGIWGEPTPGEMDDNPVYDGVGENTFTWGDETPFENASSNQLVFEGSSFDATKGSLFKIGDLTYRNGTVLLGTSVDYVPLSLSLSFDKPTEIDRVFDYEFSLINTPNLSEDPELNADFVFVAQNNAKRSFTYGGNLYTLSLTGFSQDNGETSVNEFRVLEGEKTTAAIFAKIDRVSLSKTVPEPGLAVGLSVFGIYLISRKKSQKSK